MLYTEDFTMCHYVGFSQIGSKICSVFIKEQTIIDCGFKFELIHVHFTSELKNVVAYCVFLAKLGFI